MDNRPSEQLAEPPNSDYSVLDHVEKKSRPHAIDFMKKQKAIATKYVLKLIAYDGGRHLVDIRGTENNQALNRLFREGIRKARMREFCRRYYDA